MSYEYNATDGMAKPIDPDLPTFFTPSESWNTTSTETFLNSAMQFDSAVYVHAWFTAVVLFACVLLMNLLIGVLDASYDKCEDRAQEFFVRGRARAICEMATRWPCFSGKFKYWADKRVRYAKGKESHGEEAISLRSQLNRVIWLRMSKS